MSLLVRIPLPQDAPATFEDIPAEPVGPRTYRLLAPPWISYDVACGDLVEVDPEAGDLPALTGISAGSGHLTIRFLTAETTSLSQQMAVLVALRAAGARPEPSRGRYHALDVPPEADVEALLEALELWSERGVIEYEIVDTAAPDTE